MNNNKKNRKIIIILGIIPTIWFSLLISPSLNGGFPQVIKNIPLIIDNPFKITWCKNSLKGIFIFIIVYICIVCFYLSTRKNYRKGEEHGSARWGNIKEVNKKYFQSLL